MKTPATFLLLAALLAAATASAQTTFRLGLRGGANRALTTLDGASNGVDGFTNLSADKSAIYAWQAGAVLEVDFGKFALQPGLVFAQKGERLHTATSSRDIGFASYIDRTSTNRYNWLELPLNAVYTLHGDHGLQVFAGPYVALAVGGHQRGTVTNYSAYSWRAQNPMTSEIDAGVVYGPNTNNRRFDAGVNFGVGYRQGPVQVQLAYGLGLRNLHQPTAADYAHNFDADAAYNRVAQLTGTYFFAL